MSASFTVLASTPEAHNLAILVLWLGIPAAIFICTLFGWEEPPK